MKNFTRFSLLAAVFATVSTLSVSATAATATGNASANVLTPIAITQGTALNFGTFAGNGSGTVVIASGGGRTATGGVLLTAGVTPSAASFTVTGTGSATFGVTYPASFNVTNGTGGTMPVTVTGAATGTLASGTVALPVGGTITVAANQAAGAYTGTYTMTVEYN